MVSQRKIAIVSTFANACGGSEGRAVHLYRLLSGHAQAELWTEGEPDAALAARWPIRRIDEGGGSHPTDCDLILVGAPRFGRWVRRARLRRVTVIYNSNNPKRLARRLRRLERVPKEELRMVFASERLARSVPYEGDVQLSPIDLERFAPAPRSWGGLRVGRLSRDERYKHGEDDPDLYRRLAAEGVTVRVRGGTCLAPELNGSAGIDLSPEDPVGPERFLQGLDVFFYRTRRDWFEASARVVVEALATGLVVVAHRAGGYVDYVHHGENGFLFEEQDEAMAHILRLRDDSALLERMRAAARASAEELYSEEALAEIIAFYAA